MVVQEVYFGRIPEIENMFQLFKKLRNEYKVYKTWKNSKNISALESAIEDFFGFKAFALKIDNNSLPNAYTYPVAMSIDINPADYIVSTSKGYRYTKAANAASMSYITKGLLTGSNFTDEEVFAIFLHEIGHSFVHRSPMIIAQQEVYKNTLILQIIYNILLGLMTGNVLQIGQSVYAYLMSHNGFKYMKTEFNKMCKKTPLLRELGVTYDVAVGALSSMITNAAYFITSITGMNWLAVWLNKKHYDNIDKNQFKITGHSQAYARSMERLSDDFATIYGFGNEISTGLVKMEDYDNQGVFMRITHSIPVIGYIFKKQDAMVTEMNGLISAHPSSPDRILSILDNMESDLRKDKEMPEKVKRELKSNIRKQKAIIEDLKKDQPTIVENKNEYIQALTAMGLNAGNTEDFMEKKFTDPAQIEKFYKERKVRKESAFIQNLIDEGVWDYMV